MAAADVVHTHNSKFSGKYRLKLHALINLRTTTYPGFQFTTRSLGFSNSRMPKMAPGNEDYTPKDSIKEALNGSMITGAAGLFISSIQNSMTKRNVGAMAVFTRTGSTALIFGMSSLVCRCQQQYFDSAQLPWEELTNSPKMLLPTYGRRTTAITRPSEDSWPARSWACDVSSKILHPS